MSMAATLIRCANCGTPVWVGRSTARFCSDTCRVAAWRARQQSTSTSEGNTMANVGQHAAGGNSLFPTRPGFTPPSYANTPPSPVRADAVQFSGTNAQIADAAIRHAASAFQSHVLGIDPSVYSDSGLTQQIAGFQGTDAYQAATNAVAAVQADVADADQTVADLRAQLAAPSDDVSTQLAAQAYWNRKVRLLDSIDPGGPLLSAAQGLVADASPSELAVLATELPDYLKSRGQVDTSWVDQAMASVTPELSAAIANANANAKALAYTQHNYQQLVNKVTKTQTPAGYRTPSFVPLPE